MLKQKLAEYERQLITDALIHTHGNHFAAARLLGIPRSTLRKKVDAYLAQNAHPTDIETTDEDDDE
jgi:DNA-binding NtrC family response regulator